MRRKIMTVTAAAALSVLPASQAFATTPPDDPNDVEEINNPVDENDESGFDDWGLLGLVGLLGLAGLAGRRRYESPSVTTTREDVYTRR
jgi:hypothetical protein